MMPDPADPRLGTVVAGYRIEERIGRGGMGVVYRAEHQTLRRRAALKIIAPELADTKDFRERFLREARIAAALKHPNIVTVYDAGEVGGMLYIAMQYIRGSDLARDPARGAPAAARTGCSTSAARSPSALDAAHGTALIHRDVKPANVLIDGRRAYLTDFGLTKRAGDARATSPAPARSSARRTTSRPSRSRAARSTAAPTSTRSRCLLFHCLVGDVPFPRDNDMAVLYAHLHDDAAEALRARARPAAGLDAVIAKALDKSPDRRFATCAELISAARVVVDAAGPLAEHRAGRRGVPGRAATRPTSTDARSAGIGADPRRRAGQPCRRRTSGARVLLAGVDAERARDRAGGDRRSAARSRLIGEGDDVVEAARERRPDLIVLDWNAADRRRATSSTRCAPTPSPATSKVLLVVARQAGRHAGGRARGRRRDAGHPVLPAAAAGEAPQAPGRRRRRDMSRTCG